MSSEVFKLNTFGTQPAKDSTPSSQFNYSAKCSFSCSNLWSIKAVAGRCLYRPVHLHQESDSESRLSMGRRARRPCIVCARHVPRVRHELVEVEEGSAASRSQEDVHECPVKIVLRPARVKKSAAVTLYSPKLQALPADISTRLPHLWLWLLPAQKLHLTSCHLHVHLSTSVCKRDLAIS